MAKTVEILETERKRWEIGDLATIHLFLEGTFYRAYEWSAWLWCRHISDFKPTKRELKSEAGETIVYVGFPTTSLSRHVPETAKVLQTADKSVDIVLDMAAPSEDDASRLQTDFANWKSSLPMAAPKKPPVGEELLSGSAGHPRRMTDVLHKVLSFPIERRSPLECYEFLAELKHDMAALL